VKRSLRVLVAGFFVQRAHTSGGSKPVFLPSDVGGGSLFFFFFFLCRVMKMKMASGPFPSKRKPVFPLLLAGRGAGNGSGGWVFLGGEAT